MNTRRIKKRSASTLEEKYEQWKAFAAGCQEQHSAIASLLKRKRKKRVLVGS